MIRLTQATPACPSWISRLLHVVVVLPLPTLLPIAHAGELASPSLAQSAKLRVDSSYRGYHSGVLVDRRWYAKGEEKSDASDANRLGNGGNTWVSGDATSEHWICLEWPQPVTLNEVEIWWSLAEWYPRAARIEIEKDGRWIPAGVAEGWFAPTDRQSVTAFPKTETRRLRLFQPEAGANLRRILASQEILVFNREGGPRPLAGVRSISPAALARMAPRPLPRNIARLSEECPGAAAAVRWNARNEVSSLPGLVDGNLAEPAAALEPGEALGVTWPVRHSIDSVALVAASAIPSVQGLVVEADDGLRWRPILAGLNTKCSREDLRIEWTFEPAVTRAIRVRQTAGEKLLLTELEVLRFVPKGKDVWPERLAGQVGLKQAMLDAPEDPSFEALALCAHGMASTRFAIGLKDHPKETGVDWEGSLIDREMIRFRLGPEQRTLAECRDTLRRTLIDGWRPGILIEARAGDLQVCETAFAVPMGTPARPVVFVRLSIRNLSSRPRNECLEVSVCGERPGPLSSDGVIARGDDAVLLSLAPAARGEVSGSLNLAFPLSAGEVTHFDFLHPQEDGTSLADLEACRGASYERALQEFRDDWDRIMATETVLEVPEPRVNLAVRSAIAQAFVGADGDVLCYGAAPSVYEGGLFGYEESFPMLGLALFGHPKDAQRYMSATYLTPTFLRKVDEYSLKDIEARHQQYRNGLQPHYAVSLFRLTRDEAWMRRHLPLLKQCAEWTIAQRRRTMQLENGQKPLHWGLLPKWAYGGDVLDVLGYPLFANLCCWRGLVDTSWVLTELGDQQAAQRCRDEAIAYRADIDRAIQGSYLKDHKPPLLPLRVGGAKADEMQDFYQLFAGCLFDVEPFARGSRSARWITDYLEQSNRMFCHLPRYRPMGPGALDAIYGKGYLLHLLHEDAVRDFLLGFYAYLAFNMERETFVSRESNVLFPSDLHERSSYPAAEITDPLTCGSAVILHLVRHMLVTEERGEAGAYSGNLVLLAAAPRPWLEDGKRIRLRQVPTHFGPMSLEVRSVVGKGSIEARISPPCRDTCPKIKLRLRHPENRPIRSVQVDGKPWHDFDSQKEWIVLPGDAGPLRVEARYE